jgi:hypothetical protein
VRQTEPGHELLHHRMIDADAVRRVQPGAQIAQFGVRHGRQLRPQCIAERLEPKGHMVMLRTGRRLAQCV